MNMATESDNTTTAERVAVPQNQVSKHINICEHEEFKCPLYKEKKRKRYFIQALKLALTYCYNSIFFFLLYCMYIVTVRYIPLSLYTNIHTLRLLVGYN